MATKSAAKPTATSARRMTRAAREGRGLPSVKGRVSLVAVKKIYTPESGRSDRPERTAIASQGSAVPRKRMEIKVKEKTAGDKLPERFALHLRSIMADRKWSSQDVADRLTAAGVKIGDRAVDAWLRGSASPKFKDLEKIGRALGFSDYRELLPPPIGGK